MARKQRIRSKSGFYHIMLRGNERRDIFHDDNDRERFLETLRLKKQNKEFYLQAFCLMNNHLHLMISEGTEEIAKVMKRITVSYVQYFNKKYRRVGHLFQDRFKSECVEDERYVLALMRYIHQNPVKARLVDKVSCYNWSSYKCYLNEDDYSEIVDTKLILELFSPQIENARQLYREYMEQESAESFIDVNEKDVALDEEEGKVIFERMLEDRGVSLQSLEKGLISDDFIREFKGKTNLSIRKIACIMNINKDRVNKALRDK